MIDSPPSRLNDNWYFSTITCSSYVTIENHCFLVVVLLQRSPVGSSHSALLKWHDPEAPVPQDWQRRVAMWFNQHTWEICGQPEHTLCLDPFDP